MPSPPKPCENPLDYYWELYSEAEKKSSSNDYLGEQSFLIRSNVILPYPQAFIL
jgi:hypothetical protein